MKTVAFIHGWSEGNWHTKALVEELEKQGLQVIKDVEKADIIIAHSIGTLRLPKNPKANLLVLIGIPHWPNKSIVKSLAQNLKHEAGLKHGLMWWSRRSFWATIYALRGSRTTYKVLRRRVRADLRLPLASDKLIIILIRNELDSFMHKGIHELLPETKKYHLVEMPGGHEDWWLNPHRYVDIIRKHI